MKIVKIVFVAFVAVLLLGQFYRTGKNTSSVANENSIARQFAVTPDVDEILRTSCYDCHSDNTAYPWYAGIQPVAWWLGGHIANGKRRLNFDQFATYNAARQFQKLEEIKDQVNEGEMPLSSYTLIHRYAILSGDQKSQLYQWVDAMRDTMKMHYPADSLKQPARRP